MAKQVLTHNFSEIISGMLKRAEDLSQPLTDFQGYMIRQTDLTFRRLGAKGSGTFRGITWHWFADQYTRKDGTIVPAEGGVMRVDGKGIVKGKKRHSGKRVTAASRLLQDQGLLRSSALSRFRIGKKYLIMSTPQHYAKAQNEMRKFAFITEDDKKVLIRMLKKWLINE